MDNFKIIYKILKHLEASLDVSVFDTDAISAKKLGISETKLERLFIMLQESNYIKGITTAQMLGDDRPHIVGTVTPAITLKGLEYLNENITVKKAAMLMGNKDIAPGA